MFTKNIFKDKDTVADLVGNILEADYKVKKEELKGNQHKIDMNKNNKIDAHDFKLLRSKRTQKEEVEGVEEAYQKNTNTHDDLATRGISRISMNKTPAGKKKEFDRGTELLKHQMRTTKATGGVSGPKGKLPEEVEQIDELNKDTLYSYNKKAGADVEKKDKSLGQLIRKGDSVGANKTARQLNNRLAGQERAEKRLNKEEVEQIDERELTKGETSEKERIVKGMKKSLSGFKQRYGDRAKSVMYATATKAAKKD